MRKIVISILALSLAAAWLISCGESSRPKVQPQTSTFAFMQEAPSVGSHLFSPVLGKFTTTGSNTTFSTITYVDTGTNQPIVMELYSIILSADGKKATFDLYGGLEGTSNQWDIFVANTDGTGTPLQITNDGYDNAVPQFSPDGTKVIYNSYRYTEPYGWGYQIVIRNANGSAGETVLPLPPGVYSTAAPTYSPDGTKIAVQGHAVDANYNYYTGIWMMDANGSNSQQLTNPYAAGECWCWDRFPSFTANGNQIIFSRYDDTGSTDVEHIYIMSANGGAATALTSGNSANFDPLVHNIAGVGERILFTSNRDNPTLGFPGFDLYSMNMDGTGVTRLTSNSLYDAFNRDWYDSGDLSAASKHARGPVTGKNPVPRGHVQGHKVNW